MIEVKNELISVREFLKQGRGLNLEIEELQEARQKAYDLACSVSQKKEGEQSVDKKFTNYAEYSARIDARIEVLSIHRNKMLEIINEIPSTVYRTLLIARYINCKSWEGVAERIGYESVKWVRTSMHDKAIAAAEKIKILP